MGTLHTNSNYHGVLYVALVSLTALPLNLTKGKENSVLANPTMILIFGAATFISLYMLMTKLLPPKQEDKQLSDDIFCTRGPLYYWCAVCSWFCMTDVIDYSKLRFAFQSKEKETRFRIILFKRYDKELV